MARSGRITAGPARLGPERNDGDIFGEARTALDQHPDISSAVHVHIASSVATLTGFVQWPGEQALAVESVKRVKGVRQVINRMTVAHAVDWRGFDPPDRR